MTSRARTASLLALAFVSGAAALTYEVVFFRGLGLVFGVASHAVAAVVGAFLFGLGVGAWLGGRWLERFAPLRAYAVVEAGIALFGLLAPTLLLHARRAAERGDFGLDSPALALLGAFALLAWPTLLMGATFPLLGRAIASGSTARGTWSSIGWLYGLNTLGACAGALLAAYALLPRLGLSGSTYAAVGANALLAVLALALSAAHGPQPSGRDPASASAPSSAPPALLQGSVAAIGFAAIAMQVLGNRLILSLLGGTVYVFAAIVAVFLLGIASGGALGGHLAGRSRAPVRRLGHLALGFAAAVGLGLALLELRTGGEDLLAGPDGIGLLDPGEWVSEFAPARYLRLTLGVACLGLFPATFLSGAFFPVALACARGAREQLGASLGRVYLWNTLGSIAGSLAASFALLPWLGLRGGFAFTWSVAALCGVLLLRSSAARAEPARRWVAPAAAFAALLGALALVPGDPPGTRDGLTTIFAADSAASSAKVQEFRDAVEPDAVRNLRVNGKTVASSIFIDRRLQYLLGFVSVLAHDEPRSMLCIGLGTGMTSAAMAVAGGELTVVEISPAVIDAARRFERWNAALHARADVELVNDDGRAWLARTPQRFDVISADPIDPCVSGSAYLYTEEYYQLGRARLADGGLMSQWIPLYDLAPRDVAGIVLTFQRVFPHATAWVTGYDMLLLGGAEPLRIELARLAERMEEPELRAMLADVGIESAEELLGCCFAGPLTLERFAALADRPNTDDDPWIEFHAPLAAYGTYPLEVYRALAAGDDPPPLTPDADPFVRRAVLDERRRLQQGALDFIAHIEAGRGYGSARTRYIELLRAR